MATLMDDWELCPTGCRKSEPWHVGKVDEGVDEFRLEKSNSPPGTGGVARSAGVVDGSNGSPIKVNHFDFTTTPALRFSLSSNSHLHRPRLHQSQSSSSVFRPAQNRDSSAPTPPPTKYHS